MKIKKKALLALAVAAAMTMGTTAVSAAGEITDPAAAGMSAGSDAPCTDPDPISWIYKACNHSVPEQSLSVYEALRLCTYNGAWTTFDEKERGSLEVGKNADMSGKTV